MEHHTTTSRAEAERLLRIAEKFLGNKDFSACRDFAILAQETEPLLEGSDQILAVAEVHLADQKRQPITASNANHHDWYSILQIPNRSAESDLIKKQYRRLALLLHPDKNKYPFADSAFGLVADAWAILSDPSKKSLYDHDTAPRFAKVDLVSVKRQKTQPSSSQNRPMVGVDPSDSQHQKLPVRRSRGRPAGKVNKSTTTSTTINNTKANSTTNTNTNTNTNTYATSGGGRNLRNFWTACPYCYNLYEYSRMYEGCCLRCDNGKCRRAFTAAEVLSMPPMVPGREAYYCCWGFFPMGFRVEGAAVGDGFPKWMPPLFGDEGVEKEEEPTPTPPPPPPRPAAAGVSSSTTGKKKRGRPRKNF